MVSFNAIVRESILKEQRAFKLREFFSLNPKVWTYEMLISGELRFKFNKYFRF